MSASHMRFQHAPRLRHDTSETQLAQSLPNLQMICATKEQSENTNLPPLKMFSASSEVNALVLRYQPFWSQDLHQSVVTIDARSQKE